MDNSHLGYRLPGPSYIFVFSTGHWRTFGINGWSMKHNSANGFSKI